MYTVRMILFRLKNKLTDLEKKEAPFKVFTLIVIIRIEQLALIQTEC